MNELHSVNIHDNDYKDWLDFYSIVKYNKVAFLGW